MIIPPTRRTHGASRAPRISAAAPGALAALLFLLLLLRPAAAQTDSVDAARWEFSGRAGVEVDGLGEAFGSGALFDSRLPPAGEIGDPTTPDEVALATRFRDQSTRASALVDLRLERTGASWTRLRGVVRSSRSRTRGELDARLGLPAGPGELTLGNRLDFQGGPEGSGAGVDDVLSAAWAFDGLPAGLALRVAATGERSWAGSDTLDALLDYRVLRPAIDLRKRFGFSGDAALRSGWSRKWTTAGAAGAYEELWVEADATRYFGLIRRWSASVRSEGRRYAGGDSLTPSYDELTAEVHGEIGAPGPWVLELDPRLRRTAYARDDSLLFRDHRLAEVAVRLESPLGGLFGRGDDALALSSDWTVSIGWRGSWLRHERDADTDYGSHALLLGVSRSPSDRLWLDVTAELGRRDYRASVSGSGIVFEGLNISLSGSDYTFYTLSALAEVGVGAGLRADLFGMVDYEAHSIEADDFTLWSFTAALTRAF